MPWYIVTTKLTPVAGHNPLRKTTAPCVFSEECSDQTGAHHSVLMDGDDLDALRRSSMHITRVELVPDHVVAAVRKSSA